MALADEVTNRLSTARLVQLTNSDGELQTTVNTTRLALAVTDAQATFELEAGDTYDNNNPVHVRLCFSGVISILQEYGGNGGEFAVAHRKNWEQGLATLRQRLGGFAVSSSNLVIETEQARRPKMTDTAFSGYTATPGSSSDDDSLLNAGIGL